MMLVHGTAYRTNLQNTLKLSTLRALKQNFGLTWPKIREYMGGLDDDAALGEILGDVEFQAWIWAWIVNAGDHMTMQELGDLTVDDIEFTKDDDEKPVEVEPVDPTKASPKTASAPVDAKPKSAKRQSSSTKTSK
jgi:hypothetical protein